MALNAQVSKQILILGITELVLALVSVICGAVVMSKLTSPAHVTIGIWALYFVIPGFLCVAAGHYKTPGLMGFGLAANIVGIFLSMAAVLMGAVIWLVFDSLCVSWSRVLYNYCYCGGYYWATNVAVYPVSCTDLVTVKNGIGAATIMHAFLMVAAFVGSIFGCAGTCCAPREPTVVIAATGQPNTIVMSTQQQQMSHAPPLYNVQPYPGFVSQQQPDPAGMPPQQAYPGSVPSGDTAQPAYPGTDNKVPIQY